MAVVALGLVTSVAVSPARPASAVDSMQLTLVSQAVVVTPDTDTTISFSTDVPIPPEATVVVQAYTRIETRGDVRRAIDEGRLGTVVSGGRVEFDPTQLVPVESTYSLTIGVQTGRTDGTRLRLANPGLYPLTVQVLVDDEPIASLLTFIERAGDSPPRGKVLAAVVADVDAAPSLQVDGTSVVNSAARADLETLIGLLEATPAPITVAVRPELLAALDDSEVDGDAALLARLKSALSDSTIVPDTFVALDPARSVAGDLGAEFDNQLRLGEDAIRTALGIGTARKTWWVRDPIDSAGLALLRRYGFGQLLVGGDLRADLPRGDGQLGTPVANQDGVMPSLMGDLVVQNRLLRPTTDPMLTAHHIVADLLAMSIEDENALDDDEVAPPLGLLIDASLLDGTGRSVFQDVLSLLDETTRIEIDDAGQIVDRLFAASAPSLLDRFTVKTPPAEVDAARVATDVARLRSAIDSTETMLPRGTDDPSRWRAIADVVPATNLSEADRDVYIRQLDGEIGELRECITVRTSGEVSLGGRSSEVPLTLLNSCPTPLTVRVRLSSPKLRLSQPDIVIEVADRSPLEIPVEARTNGIFIVTVELLTPGGTQPAQLSRPVTFTVEASALTGLGQVISGALLVVLLTWWVQHGLKRRRNGRAAAAAERATTHPSASHLATASESGTDPGSESESTLDPEAPADPATALTSDSD